MSGPKGFRKARSAPRSAATATKSSRPLVLLPDMARIFGRDCAFRSAEMISSPSASGMKTCAGGVLRRQIKLVGIDWRSSRRYWSLRGNTEVLPRRVLDAIRRHDRPPHRVPRVSSYLADRRPIPVPFTLCLALGTRQTITDHCYASQGGFETGGYEDSVNAPELQNIVGGDCSASSDGRVLPLTNEMEHRLDSIRAGVSLSRLGRIDVVDDALRIDRCQCVKAVDQLVELILDLRQI